MQIQVSTGSNIDAGERLALSVEGDVASALYRFRDYIARVGIRVSAGTDEARCSIEARLSGRIPTAVDCSAATTEQAVSGAMAELVRQLEGKITLEERRQHGTSALE